MSSRVALLLAALLALGVGACARELQAVAAFPWCTTRVPQPVRELCDGPNQNCACSPRAFRNGCDPFSYKCTALKCNGQPCASKCVNNQCIPDVPFSFRLVWNADVDVDLASEDPNGCLTNYEDNCDGPGSTKSVLYYDCQEDDDDCPLPNKQEFLGVSSPVAGTYAVTVTYYYDNDVEGSIPFDLYVTKGSTTTKFTGSLAEEDDEVTFNISYP